MPTLRSLLMVSLSSTTMVVTLEEKDYRTLEVWEPLESKIKL